jgi:transcriptional regulator with XRE-family HTH domain
MENLVKTLRELLGLNQADFGRLFNRAWQSVQQYEGGRRPPAEVIEKLKNIATANGHADVAIALSGSDWTVKRVFHPGETIISAPKPKAGGSSGDDRGHLHALLDEILDSGDADALQAVIPNLEVFAKYVRVRHTPPKKRAVR